MRNVPSTTGFDGYGKISGKTGNTPTFTPGKAFYEDLIQKANTVPLVRVFRHYHLRVDEQNHNITCPFMSHKGGRENSASFNYYHETNSWFCFGCHTGGSHAHACEFVSNMEGISRAKAAYQILKQFAGDVDDGVFFEAPNYSERLEIMMDFSNTVRNFRQSKFDEISLAFIDEMSATYDKFNSRHDLNNEALRSIVDQLKEKIASYEVVFCKS